MVLYWTGCMAMGDFSTPLRFARNDGGERGLGCPLPAVLLPWEKKVDLRIETSDAPLARGSRGFKRFRGCWWRPAGASFKECDPLHYFTCPPSFRGAQVIEEPSLPALDNFQLSCYYLLKIRSIELHTVELRFLSIRNISRSALFSVGRLFLQGSLLLCIFWRFV